MRRFTEVISTPHGKESVRAVRGLVLIHLFNEVWRVGKAKYVKGKLHSVIYSPEDKEYHVWGEDVKSFYGEYDEYRTWRFMSKPDPAKVKIYILTSILDRRENWSWDLTEKPIKDSVYVIVYNNGTIKKIVSTGEWAPEVIMRLSSFGSTPETIHPVAYKIQ